METVARNAGQALALHKTRRAGDLTTRSQALEELQEALGLPEAPLRIECIDVSHLQGTDVVAWLVVFEDGLPRKSEYRRFAIRGGGQDDICVDHARSIAGGSAATSTSVPARLTRASAADPRRTRTRGSTRSPDGPQRFAYPPNLFVVDGGQPQVEAAQAALESWASTTSRSSGSPSGWRRYGCRATPTR